MTEMRGFSGVRSTTHLLATGRGRAAGWYWNARHYESDVRGDKRISRDGMVTCSVIPVIGEPWASGALGLRVDISTSNLPIQGGALQILNIRKLRSVILEHCVIQTVLC